MTELLRDIGYTGKERNALLRKIGDVTEEASRAIWSNVKLVVRLTISTKQLVQSSRRLEFFCVKR